MRLLFSALSLFVSVSAGPLYTVRAVGPDNSVATSVGSDGSVAGYATDAYGRRSAFAFDGVLSLFSSDASAYDTSGSGMAAGVVWTEAGARAAVWEGGAARLLDFMDSYAIALNGNGAVAGSARHGQRTSAFVVTDAGVTWIDAGVWSAAYDISDAGTVAGTLQTQQGRFRAFTWSAGTGVREIGTLGGRQSWAQAISERGAVVGSSQVATGYQHAFLYQDGRMRDLGTLGGGTSSAHDINADGAVVGYSYDALGRSRAFVWRDGILYDLNQLIDPAPEWSLEAAYGINEKGQIVGTGFRNGVQTAFLLDPTALVLQTASTTAAAQPADTSVPEASNLFAFLFGVATMATMSGRARLH